MTYEEILEKVQSGELPTHGIIRRTGSAANIRVTTVVDGETVEVPVVNLEESPVEEEVTE